MAKFMSQQMTALMVLKAMSQRSSMIWCRTKRMMRFIHVGAPGMLKYVDQKFENHPHAYLSMESRMACGMGACYACVVHLKKCTRSG